MVKRMNLYNIFFAILFGYIELNPIYLQVKQDLTIQKPILPFF